MTREEFIEILDREGYSYEIEGDKIVVTEGNGHGDVYFVSLETLPPGIEFKNRGDVNLYSLTSLPSGVEFKNGWDVKLNSLKTLPPGVVFNNGRIVFLNSLKTIPPGVVFDNEDEVALKSLVGGYFSEWPGNIEGVDSKRLLNLMISNGMFI